MFYDKNVQNSIIKKLNKEFKCENDRNNYGITVLNSLLSEIISEDTKKSDKKTFNNDCLQIVDFIAEIILILRNSSKKIKNLDKYILRVCNKIFSQKLLFMVEDKENIENKAANCIIKYRHFGEIDKNINEIYKNSTGSVKTALEKTFKGILLKNNNLENNDNFDDKLNILNNIKNDDIENKLKNEDIENKLKNEDIENKLKNDDIEKTKNEDKNTVQIIYTNFVKKINEKIKKIEYFEFSEIWNNCEIFSKNFKLIRNRIIFEVLQKKNKLCKNELKKKTSKNDLIVINEVNDCLNLFNFGILYLQSNSIDKSQTCFVKIFESELIYEISCYILALIHFYKLEFQESKYFIQCGLKYLEHKNSENEKKFQIYYFL